MYAEKEVDLGFGSMAILETNDGYRVCHVTENFKDGVSTGKRYLSSEITWEQFIRSCERMEDGKVFLIGGESALTQMAQEQAAKRDLK